MMQDPKLSYLESADSLDFYRYHCRFLRYFYTPMAYYEKLLTRQIRETIDYVRGNYSVIYMFRGDTPVGYGVITRGGARNRFCTKEDAVLCSIWIQPEERGKGYSKPLIRTLAKYAAQNARDIYEYINFKNIPSIRAAEACGLRLAGQAVHGGLLQTVVPVEKGTHGIYRLERESWEEKTEAASD